MLSLNQIKEYYPENLRGFERFMLREYLQYKIAEIIFESKYANHLSFIGGTALRIVHGNNRFSEDLDFDNFNVSPEEFEQITEIIKNGLELEGYKIEIRSVTKTAYHCYIRFPAILFNNNLSPHSEEKILIRVDTESQLFEFTPKRHLLNMFDVFTEIKVTPADILLSQKFLTILERKQSKGRDFYDVVFLLGKNIKPNYTFLMQKTEIDDGKSLKNNILKKLESLDLKSLAEDVKPFLMKPGDTKKIEKFKEYFKQIDL